MTATTKNDKSCTLQTIKIDKSTLQTHGLISNREARVKNKLLPVKWETVPESEIRELIQASQHRTFQEWMSIKAKHKFSNTPKLPKPSMVLSQLVFVFTGELFSFTRAQAKKVVEYLGGRTTQVPSRLTDFVVIGSEPGPSKLKKAVKCGTIVLKEDSFQELIGARLVPDTVEIKRENGFEKVDLEAPIKEKLLYDIRGLLYSRVISIVISGNQGLKIYNGELNTAHGGYKLDWDQNGIKIYQK